MGQCCCATSRDQQEVESLDLIDTKIEVKNTKRDKGKATGAKDDIWSRPRHNCRHADCLLLNVYDLIPLFEKDFGFKCDEAFVEEAALETVTNTLKREDSRCKCGLYKFIIVDLDDPILDLPFFMK